MSRFYFFNLQFNIFLCAWFDWWWCQWNFTFNINNTFFCNAILSRKRKHFIFNWIFLFFFDEFYPATNLTICLLTFSLTQTTAWIVADWCRMTRKHCLPLPRLVWSRPRTQIVCLANDSLISRTAINCRSSFSFDWINGNVP